jgi:hypothetical protein
VVYDSDSLIFKIMYTNIYRNDWNQTANSILCKQSNANVSLGQCVSHEERSNSGVMIELQKHQHESHVK